MQNVELHFSQAPLYDFEAIKRRAEAILGDPLQYREGAIPPQTTLLALNTPIDMKNYAGEIQQSRRFPNCEAVLRPSRHPLIVAEMMAHALSPKDRCRLFHGVLRSAVEHTQPDALVFKHSQQVIDPNTYMAAAGDDPIHRPGSVNVRFFRISNSDRHMLMDTRGLHEIGLHDFQCHLRELDPNGVSRVLFDAAFYIFENGSVIESGNTIAGIDPASKWTCRYEGSLIEPNRQVIDLNPSEPYAAGGRN
jgi:hypothetical protein